MARLLTDIITIIRGSRATKPELTDLNGPLSASDYAIQEDSIGYCHWLFENKVDTLKAELLDEINNNAVATDEWWQRKILAFQYDAANPQVVVEIGFVATYPVIDTTLCIISRCSCKTVRVGNRTFVSVKVAKTVGGVLTPLNDNEQAALLAYTLRIRPAGVSMDIVSLYADRLKLVADIYFDAQYPLALIQANVIASINNYCDYLSSVKLDGQVKLSTVEDYIQQVAGVTDYKLTLAQGRDNSTPVDGVNVVVFDRVYPTSAGYIIPEDTPGHTLLDTLTFIADV